ncbi:hypothetical protein [Sphingomonas sp. KR3-1]|uniref:hypothetical protein n=1 Tax=Sphingomonas sp. KR3-1 TaxID=3156611 RepID=UPI0032B43CE1
MRMLRAVLLLSTVALAVPAVIAGTRVTLVHEARLKLSPAARQVLVRRDLASILTGPASTTGIATKPYPSLERELCRRDVIEVSYAQIGSGKNLRYEPEGVKPVEVQYRYLDLPGSHSLADRRKACASLGGTESAWVSSREGDHYVSFALSRLAQALVDVQAGAGVTLHCEDKELDCAAAFRTAARKVSSASRCAGTAPECYQYFMGDWNVTIVVEYPGNTRQTTIKLAPADIVVT